MGRGGGEGEEEGRGEAITLQDGALSTSVLNLFTVPDVCIIIYALLKMTSSCTIVKTRMQFHR